jgi:hypothetical protein
MNYKDFEINTPGTPRPWGAREEQALKDIIDTVVGQTVTGVKTITGHTHLTSTGVQGITGLQGKTGIQGFKGATGAQGGGTGLQGITGLWGITGIQGQTGIQGITGLQSNTGLQGITGLWGITGLQGNTGIQGATGIGASSGVSGTAGKLIKFGTATTGVDSVVTELSGNIGINQPVPVMPLDMDADSSGNGIWAYYRKIGYGIHGMTGVAPADVAGQITASSIGSGSTSGGLQITGLSKAITGLTLNGYIDDPYNPGVNIVGAAKSGSSIGSMAASKTVLQVTNYITPVITTYGNGNTAFTGDVYTTAFTTWIPTTNVIGGAGPQYSVTYALYKKVGNTVNFSLTLMGDGGTDGSGANTLYVRLPVDRNSSYYVGSFIGSGQYYNGGTNAGVSVECSGDGSDYSWMSFVTGAGSRLIGNDQNNSTRGIRVFGSYETQ